MNHLLLNAFFDNVNSVAPIITSVLLLLMLIELIYVMAKYLGSSTPKEK